MSDGIFNALHESCTPLHEDNVHDETGAIKAWDGVTQPSTPSPARPQNGTKGLRTTFEIVTPESAEQGDADERGWIDEDGECMDPDEIDTEEGLTAVDLAVKFLHKNTGEGGLEWSGGSAEHGWWTSNKFDVDYSTGGEESRGYHPYGFSPEEVADINAQLKVR